MMTSFEGLVTLAALMSMGRPTAVAILDAAGRLDDNMCAVAYIQLVPGQNSTPYRLS